MIKVLGVALIFGAFAASSTLMGDHICHRQENYTETVNTTTEEPVQVRKNFWCLEKIRCSEMQPELKEVIHAENVTKSRTIDFCCPDYEESELDGKKFCKPICMTKCINGYCVSPDKCECEIGYLGATCDKQCPPNRFGKMCIAYCKCGELHCHPQTGECLKAGEKIDLSTTTTMSTKVNPFMTKIIVNATVKPETTEHNPYSNYSGEYGKEFNHYVKMGVNESDVQQSIDKIIDIELKNADEELQQRVLNDIDGYILVDVAGNEIHSIEPLKHPQYVIDHHAVNHHDESIAMVTVGCLVLGMLVFFLAMVYIRRVTRRIPASRDIDPEADMQKAEKPQRLHSSKIVHEPLPIPPLRPSLRKAKSVTFDESIDEVDELDRPRTRSLPDAYDVPRRQNSMMDIYAQSVKITPRDIAIYSLSQKPATFNTFPRKNVSRKQSMEHIYDEIAAKISPEIADARMKSDKIDDASQTAALYENHESIEKTKM